MMAVTLSSSVRACFRAQPRSRAVGSSWSPDSLKQVCTEGRAGQAHFRCSQLTSCRAVSTSTIERSSVAVEAKTGTAKQEVVSYDGVEFEVTDNPELKSTFQHRAIVASSSVVLSMLFAHGASQSMNGFAIAACMLAGYVFAGALTSSTFMQTALAAF
jgi:hypothetical protein